MAGFKKPHAFGKDEISKPTPPLSAFVAGAPIELPPSLGNVPHDMPALPEWARTTPKPEEKALPKTAKVKDGHKRETVIFPMALSKAIRDLGATEFMDFSNLTRVLVLEALKARGVKVQ